MNSKMKVALTIEEAAEACSLSPRLISKAIHRGDLPAKRSARTEDGDGAGKYLIGVDNLHTWFDSLADA